MNSIVQPRLSPPEQMQDYQWLAYLDGAVARETGEPPQRAKHEAKAWARLLKRLRSEGVEPYLLALSLDVLALDWAETRGLSPHVILSPGRLLHWYYGRTRPPWFWHAVWWSRFATTGEQVDYHREWLDLTEAALEIEAGHEGRAAALEDAREHLAAAERVERRRARTPAFALNWLRERREELC